MKIFFDTMLDGLLAITFRFKSNLLNNIYHTEGAFLFGESKFSRFRVRKECEIKIGSVTLVTFRKRVQYDDLLTNYAMIPC